MSQTFNLLLLLLPPEMLGLFTLALIMAGGFLIMAGARRKGTVLVITGVSLPLVMVLVEALMNEMFIALPEGLVMSVAIVLQVLIYAMIGWSLVRLVFGQKAIDEAKGHLLADAVKWFLRRIFSAKGAMVLGSLLIFSWIGMAG